MGDGGWGMGDGGEERGVQCSAVLPIPGADSGGKRRGVPAAPTESKPNTARNGRPRRVVASEVPAIRRRGVDPDAGAGTVLATGPPRGRAPLLSP